MPKLDVQDIDRMLGLPCARDKFVRLVGMHVDLDEVMRNKPMLAVLLKEVEAYQLSANKLAPVALDSHHYKAFRRMAARAAARCGGFGQPGYYAAIGLAFLRLYLKQEASK